MQAMTEATFQLSLLRVKALTREASKRVDELVFTFGRLEPDSPERKVLEAKVSEVLSTWSDRVWECGGLPQELWTVVFHTAKGPVRWQYPCSRLIEAPQVVAGP